MQRFARILLTVRGSKQLHHDLERWDEILRVDGRAGHVRTVKVVGRMPPPDHDGEEEDIAVANASAEDDEGSDSDSELDLCELPKRPILFDGSRPQPTQPERKKELDQPWIRLAHFLSRLSGLKDLVWACHNQLPPCLLSAVHEHHPRSRLHMHTFSLRSLYQDRNHLHRIDPDESAIATSPCLTSLAVTHYAFGTDGKVNYNEEAIFDMVAGLASNLTSVSMWLMHPGASIDLQDAYATPRPPWQGFFPGSPRRETSAGHLQHLMLGWGGLSSDSIMAWSNRTNFDELRSLEIDDDISLEVLRTMTSLAQGGTFQSLRRLALAVRSEEQAEWIHMDEATGLFLEALGPLEDLSLSGFCANVSFNAVLDRHGRSLRKLRLIPARKYRMVTTQFALSHQRIEEIAQGCPDLAQVEFLVPRTQGDEQEVAIYGALGQLKRLRRVSLLLDCSRMDLSNVEPGGCVRLGPNENVATEDIRDAFVNAAVDSYLAISIFRTITADNPNLERLKLKVYGAGDFGSGCFDTYMLDIMQWIGRSWVCTRNREEVVAKELGKSKRLRRGEDLESNIEDGEYEKAWRSIWPDKTGNWKAGWSSLPLSERSN
ncbi:hypothetical protein DL771_010080 [Monosporascus sp. 5C6A]|nr:hypothetical protein DL771_010080 [Monosporascus sp. 5C6A]